MIRSSTSIWPLTFTRAQKAFVKVRQIRHHVDEDKENRVLFYDYARSNMLEMISDCPPLPLQARKTILEELGLALKDMHAGNCIHLGTHLLNHKRGRVMWQSPEGRLRMGMGKHLEVFSSGLLASQI
ncbi:uncharacterized protein EAE97_003721 [Botrytis byssoidea]|uniref:Protein kinase domain-containing protein n=1 Tax=Botrytis byssoidea TaxID=139641 RepID=A0A9P5IR93_9HELO|nr:uncharacterized protein EAE97_003721 [Botrytis byssoidea]KAF7948310.1 hypothetical protein EAE97_003721 [Botrytis byssoidea]